MPNSNIAIINGDTRQFALSEDVKRYSLIDVGFKETKNKNFVYEHPLYIDSPYNANSKLKMTINEDLTKLSMVITDKNGLKKVDIFKQDQLAPVRELLDFILRDMKDKEIIVEVK